MGARDLRRAGHLSKLPADPLLALAPRRGVLLRCAGRNALRRGRGIVSGRLVFGAARGAGRAAGLERASGRLRSFLALSNTGAAAAVVTLVTAYPFGPITALHTGAGLTRMTFGSFAIALTAGAIVRAGAFSFFGSTVAGADGLWLATGLLLGGMALPLAFPRARAWLRGNLPEGA